MTMTADSQRPSTASVTGRVPLVRLDVRICRSKRLADEIDAHWIWNYAALMAHG
jgi:hypothetical protein